MTLLLICYLCGQGEKIRLSMRLMIIFIMSYIFVFTGGPVSAYDVAVQQNDDGTYTTIVESETTVTVHKDSEVKNEVATTTSQHAANKKDVKFSQEEVVDHFDELLDLKAIYSDHPIFEGNNGLVFEYIYAMVSKESPAKQKELLSNITAGLKQLSKSQLNMYSINGEYLFPVLDFILLKVEMDQAGMKKEASTPNKSTPATNSGDGGEFTMTKHDGYFVMLSDDWKKNKRMNFYVNEKLQFACEYTQCSRLKITGEAGDVVSVFVKMSGNLDSKFSFTLGEEEMKSNEHPKKVSVQVDTQPKIQETTQVETAPSEAQATVEKKTQETTEEMVETQSTDTPSSTDTTTEEEDDGFDDDIFAEFDSIVSALLQ